MKLLNLLAVLICLVVSVSAIGVEFDEKQIESEVMRVLDDFISSFSARDPRGHAATYHFPHFRLAGGVMAKLDTAEDAIRVHKGLFRSLPDTGWDRSVWIKREIVNIGEKKVHVKTRFRRLRADGSEIGSYDSLYILIKQDGRWGVKMRSSYL